VPLQSQADIAVALTAALTSRMKPPPAPRRDLRPSTAVWMLLTVIGSVLVLLPLFATMNPRWAMLVALLLLVIGYVWIVWITGLRETKRGVLCAIPPLTFYYLTQAKYASFRPLRFVLSGAVPLILPAAAPTLSTYTRPLVAKPQTNAIPPDPTTQSKLTQLRLYRDQKAYASLFNLLDVLAKTDPLKSEDANDQTELSAELRALCQHPDTEVRVRAMPAYARWDPVNARRVCLQAVGSESTEERDMALRLLPQWKDADSARAVQSLMIRPGVEANKAKAALEEIGGRPAELAALQLLNRTNHQAIRLQAIEVLEKVGGAETAATLRSYASATDDQAVRVHSLAAAEVIEARLKKPAPPPAPAP